MFLGRVDWGSISAFPEQEAADRRAGDEAVAELTALLREHVNPTLVDAARRLPDGLLDRLRAGGYLKLQADRRLGGRELSRLNVFRMVEAAASWSPVVAYLLSIGNGFGAVAYLPILPPGALRDFISERVAAGAVGCAADAEPGGAANRRRVTTATPVPGGYRLDGQKVNIGLAPVADVMDVSASLADGSGRICLFFIDTRAPGVRITAQQEYMGLNGLPIGAVRLDGAYVQGERMLGGSDDEWRRSPELAEIGRFGRTLANVAPALGIGRLCLAWSRDFVRRRRIDGRGLAEYDEIRRQLATSVAEVFALEAVARWTILNATRGAGTAAEATALKNIASVTCWRLVDRTMALLGAEGFETARSKAARGVPATPVERFLRDARAMRVAGGVDFQVDNWAAQARLAACYGLAPPADAAPAPVLSSAGSAAVEPIPSAPDAANDAVLGGRSGSDALRLSAAGRRHLDWVTAQIAEFGDACRRLVTRHGAALFGQERTLITLHQISSELLTMALVLTYASHRGAQWHHTAEVYCTTARHRLAGLWHRLTADPAPAYYGVCGQWLRTDLLDDLLAGTFTELPPVPQEDTQ
jgi:alkylation response protein AidB-like acyl-CoA dehydrogenase